MSLQSLQWKYWGGRMTCWYLQNMGCGKMGCPVACWVSNADWGDERVVGICWVWECQEGGADVLLGQGGCGEVAVCGEREAVRVAARSEHRECCGGSGARLRLSVWLEGRECVCAEAFAALCVGQGGCNVVGKTAVMCVQRWGCQCCCWICKYWGGR